MRYPQWLVRLVLGDIQPRGTFVVDAEIHRTEELRADRLGPDEDLIAEETAWEPPPDPERPRRTLG